MADEASGEPIAMFKATTLMYLITPEFLWPKYQGILCNVVTVTPPYH